MSGTGLSDISIRQCFLSTPSATPAMRTTGRSARDVGDGFTVEEIQEALNPWLMEWHPQVEYEDCDIGSLQPGSLAVTFVGRVANIFDARHTQKTPRSAKGCIKLCVKDYGCAITVRVWYAAHPPALHLGSLISVWTNHISNGEHSNLSSSSAPLFTSLFPERDRNCHIMLHKNSDNSSMFKIPLDYQVGKPLDGLMTLHNFENGGYDVPCARVLVVVKSVGVKRKVNRRDGSFTENVNIRIHDETAEATLGLWGLLASSPTAIQDSGSSGIATYQRWSSGETTLLIQSPGCRPGRICETYLSMTPATMVDINPNIPEVHWLQQWALRQRRRQAINPPFPENTFNEDSMAKNAARCLFTIADLDEHARSLPDESFQGYLSLVILETRLLELWHRQMLLSIECCGFPMYANALSASCKHCCREVKLRLNPRILGPVVDETAVIASGMLLFCDKAWYDLLGRWPEDLLKLAYEDVKYLSDRLLFCRITVVFGWTGEEHKTGGRICVLEVHS